MIEFDQYPIFVLLTITAGIELLDSVEGELFVFQAMPLERIDNRADMCG